MNPFLKRLSNFSAVAAVIIAFSCVNAVEVNETLVFPSAISTLSLINS